MHAGAVPFADAEESVRDLLRRMTDAVDATEALKATDFEGRVYSYMRCVRATASRRARTHGAPCSGDLTTCTTAG
jgi:hypothetical protein